MPHLSGDGLELGAGLHPQKLPSTAHAHVFDKRDSSGLRDLFEADAPYEVRSLEEIPVVFPSGADFLIAHNVLEHLHGEIAALITWHRWVKDGGVVVLSMPDMRFLDQDGRRRPADFDHLLLDYALDRGEEWLETREHVLSFCLGWADSWAEMSKREFVTHVLSESNRDGHDCHWHALDRRGWDRVIAASALLDGTGIEMLATADGESSGACRTHGEIIYVYRISRQDAQVRGLPDVRDDVASMRTRLDTASERLAT